jgi:hypothetical protein
MLGKVFRDRGHILLEVSWDREVQDPRTARAAVFEIMGHSAWGQYKPAARGIDPAIINQEAPMTLPGRRPLEKRKIRSRQVEDLPRISVAEPLARNSSMIHARSLSQVCHCRLNGFPFCVALDHRAKATVLIEPQCENASRPARRVRRDPTSTVYQSAGCGRVQQSDEIR